ncbi:MAG TPA: energy-coupling factor transporter ATPase [Candidatus Izemoplasmatales bacterium]|nr:energy-coupling factor transporter ATPase [Bacillota bacterium]HRY77253.1 energy-coupling factor transporter ATPase [Candidatus Izemoplasmatales bacterium]
MGIQFTKVNYRYPGWGRETYGAIADVTLSISAKDEFIALVGHTGSGKSTLAQHMNALMFPTSGTVEIFGIPVTAKRNKKTDYNSLRKRVGLVFQFPEYQLFEETVEKDIMFGPRNFRITEEDAREMAKNALKMVGLSENYLRRNPFNLSGGEKKRVSIAGILAMNPDVLVLDEPTSGLDPRGKHTLMELFRSIREETGKTIIFITHDMDLVYRYADRVLVLEAGSLVFDGTPDKLFRDPDLERWHLDYPATLSVLDNVKKSLGWDLDIYQNTVGKAADELKRAVRRP